MNEVFSSAVCHIHVIARGSFDKVAKLLKTRSWTTFSLSGAVLHMAILSADLHILILSAYWNIIWRSTYGNIICRSIYCDIICILKYYPQIWMYWNIICQSAYILKYYPQIYKMKYYLNSTSMQQKNAIFNLQRKKRRNLNPFLNLHKVPPLLCLSHCLVIFQE